VPTVRLATFNVENLFARFKFNSNVDPEEAVKDGWAVDKTAFVSFSDEAKKITGQAFKATKADIIALCEVESLDTLKRFRTRYLGGPSAYPYAVLIDGNDPRLIDVAVLSKYPLVSARSHQELRSGRSYIFSRDCLEVEVAVDGSHLTLFVNHLKSMLDKSDPKNGRRNTRARRELQAQTVMDIVRKRFGNTPGDEPWIVLGDLNDYLATDAAGKTGIAELVQWDQVENVVDRSPEEERWTHYFRGRAAPHPDSYQQLDYLLLSRALAQNSAGAPTIIRKGLAKRADRYTGPRFPDVGLDKPVASDHCPVVMDVEL
jgi:predicted extracellular nuclease